MANYPTSNPSFANKSAGQQIQSAHINAVQDEVVAIGSDLRGGLQHALSVPALTVSGAVTLALRPTMPPPDVAIVTGSTTPLANDSTTAVSWPAQATLTNSSVHSTGSNPERFTPQSTGVYVLSASLKLQAAFTAGSTANLTAFVHDSSGGTLDFQRIGASGDLTASIHLHALKRFDVVGSTQWLRIVATQRSGSTHSLDGALSFARFYKL